MIRRAAFLSLLVSAALAQRKPPDELKFSSNGAGIAIHTESSASQSPLSTSGAVSVGKDSTAYRIVLDRENRVLFAYELELLPMPPNLVRLAIKPADQRGLRALEWLKGKVSGDVPTVAAVRQFPPLRLGDEVQVDIMYNPGTGEKLWDVLRVSPEAQASPKPGKVFAGPQFSWEGVRVSIDGRLIADKGDKWMIGEAIMMRVPGRGEYYLALRAPAGFPFQPIGRVDRNVLRFRVDGEQVEIVGRSNLLMKSDSGAVWVYHVPESRSKAKVDTVSITCSGDLDLLMQQERQE